MDPQNPHKTDIFLWLLSGACWSAAYILQIRAARKHRIPPMPLLAYALNFAWELTSALFFPPRPLELTVFASWLLVDLPLLYYVLCPRSHIERAAFGAAFAAATVGMRAFFGTLLADGGEVTEPIFWAGYVCQTVLSVGSVMRLAGEYGTTGVGLGMWACRFVGSAAAGGFMIRWGWLEPERYRYATSPLAWFVVVGQVVCDLVWVGVFLWVRERERAEKVGRKRR